MMITFLLSLMSFDFVYYVLRCMCYFYYGYYTLYYTLVKSHMPLLKIVLTLLLCMFWFCVIIFIKLNVVNTYTAQISGSQLKSNEIINGTKKEQQRTYRIKTKRNNRKKTCKKTEQHTNSMPPLFLVIEWMKSITEMF